MVAFDFGECVFYQILKQEKSFTIKLPIAFQSLIFGILLKQKISILSFEVIIGVTPSILNFNYTFFTGNYVSDNLLPKL